MTSNGKDALWSFLFASDDSSLVNLKLMRGDSNEVTTQQLRDEVHLALLQAKVSSSGLDQFPEGAELNFVNVHELAASI